MPSQATIDLGCRKWVPPNVEWKLYNATTLVRFAISIDTVYRRVPSLWSKLSVPTPRLKMCRGVTRAGLWSSFSICSTGVLAGQSIVDPHCGSLISVDLTRPGLPPDLPQSSLDAATLANTPF